LSLFYVCFLNFATSFFGRIIDAYIICFQFLPKVCRSQGSKAKESQIKAGVTDY